MTDPNAPTSAQTDDPTPVSCEVLVQMSADGREAWLVLSPLGGGDVLEIPITKQDAMQLVAALAEYAWPGCRLMSASAAGPGVKRADDASNRARWLPPSGPQRSAQRTQDTMNRISNRLPALAAEIRQAHADVQEAAKTAAQRAIDAGHALIEAKDLLPHGGWLPWLREHCALAERTAQLYMKIARSGMESATVADLGLQAAGRAIVGYIDYWSQLNDAELIEWQIFQLFLAQKCGLYVEGAVYHSEWLRRGSIKTPSDWLLNGACERFWRACGKTAQPELAAGWRSFLEENRYRTAEDLDAELNRLATQHPMPMPARQRHRKRA